MTAARPGRVGGMRAAGLPYLLSLPAVLIVAAVAGWPLVKIVILSLSKQESSKFALFHHRGACSACTPHPARPNAISATSRPIGPPDYAAAGACGAPRIRPKQTGLHATDRRVQARRLGAPTGSPAAPRVSSP